MLSTISIIRTAISTAYTLTRYFAMACASAIFLFGAVSVASVSIGYRITIPVLLNAFFLLLLTWLMLSPKLLLWPIAGYNTLRHSLDGFWGKLRYNYAYMKAKHGYEDNHEEQSTAERWYQRKDRTHIHDQWAELDKEENSYV